MRCVKEAGRATGAGVLGTVVLLVCADRGVRAHRPTRAPIDLTGGGLGWLREGSLPVRMTRSSPIGARFGEGEKIFGREKKIRERERKERREGEKGSFRVFRVFET